MTYRQIVEGIFKARPNRFIAHVIINGEEHIVHVKNTGRCKELLVPGVIVYLEKSDNPLRKTQYDLIAVKKAHRLINMDSQAPNAAVGEWLKAGNFFPNPSIVKAEKKYGNSRFDFYIEEGQRKAFIEVKGVTLERDNIVLFPDAPSERAVKHVEELVGALNEGYEAYIFFIVQMENVDYFTPNIETHRAFARALVYAKEAGVKMFAYECSVTSNSMKIDHEIPIKLNVENS